MFSILHNNKKIILYCFNFSIKTQHKRTCRLHKNETLFCIFHIAKNATMSATDFDLDAATEQVNNYKNLNKFVHKIIHKYFSNTNTFNLFETKINYKNILKDKYTTLMYIVYNNKNITGTDEKEKIKCYIAIHIAINKSSKTFCFILFNLMWDLYNHKRIQENHETHFMNMIENIENEVEKAKIEQLKLNCSIQTWDIINFNNLFMELIPIINAKKMLKTQIHQQIHKKKQQLMHNEFFEQIMHPDNMQWMIENKLVENNL